MIRYIWDSQSSAVTWSHSTAPSSHRCTMFIKQCFVLMFTLTHWWLCIFLHTVCHIVPILCSLVNHACGNERILKPYWLNPRGNLQCRLAVRESAANICLLNLHLIAPRASLSLQNPNTIRVQSEYNPNTIRIHVPWVSFLRCRRIRWECTEDLRTTSGLALQAKYLQYWSSSRPIS